MTPSPFLAHVLAVAACCSYANLVDFAALDRAFRPEHQATKGRRLVALMSASAWRQIEMARAAGKSGLLVSIHPRKPMEN